MTADKLTRDIPGTATRKDSPPAVLLPYQQQWIADKSPLKVAEKSRRVGLTWAEAADDVLTAAADKSAGGQNVYYIGYNQDMAIEFIEACAMWARTFNHAASEIEEGEEIFKEGEEEKHIKTFTIRFPASRHRVVALSSRPANLRGKQGVIVIDEAAFHDKLRELIKAALALLIWGGRVRIISTHDGDANPFNELVQDIRGERRKGTVHRITFKEAVLQGLYHRVCLRLGKLWESIAEAAWVQEVYDFYGEDSREELDVIPSHGAGASLSRALIEARMIDAPVIRLSKNDEFARQPEAAKQAEIAEWCEEHLKPILDSLDKKRLHMLGEDFGRSVDLTVLAPICITQNMKRRIPFLVELRNIPFEQQKQIMIYICDRLPRFNSAAFDARGNGQYLAEQAQNQYGHDRVEAVMLSSNWYLENMPKVIAAFEDDSIEIPKDADVIDDLRALKKIDGIHRLPPEKTGEKKKRHGDAAIAIAMAYYASLMEVEEFGYTPVPKPGGSNNPDMDEDDGDYRAVRTTAGFKRGSL